MLSLTSLVLTVASSTFSGGLAVDEAINHAIAEGRLPGAVVVIGHAGKVVYRKAYGNRSLEPTVEPMTLDTVFDCASLTKVIATTSCLMKLYEQGKYRLNDRITDYIPEFQGGKSEITIRNLMTHFSGLKPDVPLKPAWTGYDTGIGLACSFAPGGPPATQHVYSDINFLLLGELVHRLSGQTLASYARQEIFLPLGMKDSMFQPPASLIPRIAPTEKPSPSEPPLRGVVHDPTARNMGGIAGHAGMFSTAGDLARFAQMMLNMGELRGKRIFSPLTVQKFTQPETPPDQPILRGLGWDIDSPYSSNRGELFPIGSYGHTGFTGTSVWIDPSTNTYVILLANSVHPVGGKSMVALRSRVATIAAASVGIAARGVSLTGYNETVAGPSFPRLTIRNASTMTGLDVLESDGFAEFKGKRIGLITNQTGIDREGRRSIDVMRAAGVQIAALFSPEHGFFGKEDRGGLENTTDPLTGIQVFSLYGETTKPTPEMLKGLDALVFDIQDVGVRFYTYETTMAYALEAAATAHLPFYVLDRPNPITGTRVEGPPMDAGNASFVGYLPGMPVRHGMTMGELARLFNGEKRLGADLHVIEMKDWQRGDWFDSTNQPWVNPSPNMRSLKAAILYPGICLLEYAKNMSVGRGTDSPFEQIGADFIKGRELAAYMNADGLGGVRFYPTSFTPTESRFKDQLVSGIRIEITDREKVDSVQLGIALGCALEKLYPGKMDWSANKRLMGHDDTLRRIAAGESPRVIQTTYQDEVRAFAALREKYLIYGR